MLGGTSRRTLAHAVTTGRPFARRGGRAAHRADRTDRPDRPGTGRALTVAGTGAVLAFTGVLVPGLLLEGSSATGTSCTPVTQPLGPATGFTEFVRTDGQRGSESEGSDRLRREPADRDDRRHPPHLRGQCADPGDRGQSRPVVQPAEGLGVRRAPVGG